MDKLTTEQKDLIKRIESWGCYVNLVKLSPEDRQTAETLIGRGSLGVALEMRLSKVRLEPLFKKKDSTDEFYALIDPSEPYHNPF